MHLNAMLNSNTSCNVSITEVFETINVSKSNGGSYWIIVDHIWIIVDHGESYPDYLCPLLLHNRNVACPGKKT